MRSILTFIILSAVANLYAQDTTQLKCPDIELDHSTIVVTHTINTPLPDCPYTIDNAKKNIAKNNLSIVIHGAFTGFDNVDKAKSERFQKKYNVNFVYLGCLRGWDIEDEDTVGYNKTILDHLSKMHGTKVMDEFAQIRN